MASLHSIEVGNTDRWLLQYCRRPCPYCRRVSYWSLAVSPSRSCKQYQSLPLARCPRSAMLIGGTTGPRRNRTGLTRNIVTNVCLKTCRLRAVPVEESAELEPRLFLSPLRRSLHVRNSLLENVSARPCAPHFNVESLHGRLPILPVIPRSDRIPIPRARMFTVPPPEFSLPLDIFPRPLFHELPVADRQVAGQTGTGV